MAEKVLEKLNREVEEKFLKLSITEGGKEGTSTVIISSKYLEETDLRTRAKQLRAKEKSR